MGLLDLFKPKWKNSNLRVRKAAVMRLEDQELLKDIAVNDKIYMVRIAAVKNKNFTDQTILSQIVKKDLRLEVRKVAIGKIKNKELLENIAQNYKVAMLREVAVKNKYFTDQVFLSQISRNDSDAKVRIAAIKKLSDQKLITEIAIKDKAWDVRETALEKITDQKIIADIAKKYENRSERISTFKKINKKKLLYEIVKKDGYYEALETIKDQDLLIKIVGKKERVGDMQWCPKCYLICKTYLYQCSDPELVQVRCKRCDKLLDTEHHYGRFEL